MLYKSVAVLAITSAAFVAGCAGPNWRKEGIAAEGVRSAIAECRYQIGLNKVPEEKQKALINDCMEGKGFRWR